MVRSSKPQTRLLSNEFVYVSSDSDDHGNDACDDDLPLTRIFTCANQDSVGVPEKKGNVDFRVLDSNEELSFTDGDSDLGDLDLNAGFGVSEEDSDCRVLEGNGDFREDGEFKVSEEEEDFRVSEEDKNAGFHGFRPGSLVWAKAFSYAWCPGWIVRRNSRGRFLVELFGSDRKKWLRESRVLDFEENYAKLASRVKENLVDVVDDALDELHRRVALGLMCCCQSPIEEIRERMEGREIKHTMEVKKGFMSREILNFVIKMAVSARVEDLEVVSATRLAAQINAFRSYVSIKRDWMYQQTMRLSENGSTIDDFEGSQQEKPSYSPSEDEILWPHIQETEVKSPKIDEENNHGLISEQGGRHSEDCMTNEMDLSVLDLDGESESRHDDQDEEAENGLGFKEQNPAIHSTLQHPGSKSKNNPIFCSPHTISDCDGFFLSDDVCCTQKEIGESDADSNDHLATDLRKIEIAQYLDDDNIPLNKFLTGRVTLPSEKQKGDTHEFDTCLEGPITEIESHLDDYDIPLNKFFTAGVPLSSKKKEGTYVIRDIHESDTCLENPNSPPDDNIPLNKFLKARVSLLSGKQKRDESAFRVARQSLEKSGAETEQKLLQSDSETPLADESKNRSFCALLTHLHCLALDPFYSGTQSIKSVRRKFLKYRAFVYKNIPNLVSEEYALGCDGEASICKEQVNSGSQYLHHVSNVTTSLVQPNGEVKVANSRKEVGSPSSFSVDSAKMKVCDTQDSVVVSINKSNNESNRLEKICRSTLPMEKTKIISKEKINSVSQSLPHLSNVVTTVLQPNDEANIAIDREEVVEPASSFSDDSVNMMVSNTEDMVGVSTSQINDKSSMVENITSSVLPKGNSSGKFIGKRKISQIAPSDLSYKLHKTHSSSSLAKLYVSPLAIDGSNSTADMHRFSKIHQNLDVPTTLHMKYPKGFKIPSKEELEMMFIRFGPLDRFKTKVFFFTGSGQVVFLHQHDAEAAYQYARTENLFGQANVRYWLHQAKPRKENGIHVSFPTKGSPLNPDAGLSHKSCLKTANLYREMDQRKPLRVKFIPGNQLSSLAATVVTGNRSFVAPDTSYNHCICEKPDISIQMLKMLEKCSQLVSTIKGSLGLESYYSIFSCDF